MENISKRNNPFWVNGRLGVGRTICVKDHINAANAERAAKVEPPMKVVVIDPVAEYQACLDAEKDGSYDVFLEAERQACLPVSKYIVNDVIE